MAEKNNPVRETDEHAIELARKLMFENRYGAIGVLEPKTGVPLVSRISLACSTQHGIFFSASDLSLHSKALALDATCSLLLGEPGKGDGLAHPRITLVCETRRLPNSDAKYSLLRAKFLEVHPKAELYIDFADFGFYPLEIKRAYLNGGFGKAYHLDADDLVFFEA